MKRLGSWFFEGYEAELFTDASGKERKRLVYRGPWYGIPRLRQTKLLAAALTLALTLSCALINFFPGELGMQALVGVPCLWALVPLMFQWIGLVNFLAARQEWEIRVYYAGYRRLGRWSIPGLALFSFTLLAELGISLFYGFPDGAPAYILGTVLCVGCELGLLLLWRRRPAAIIRSPK